MPFLADTNILLRLAEPSGPDYAIVRTAVETLLARGEHLCYAPQNLVEFWNVCTRPIERNGFGLSIAETDARAKLIEARFRFLPDSERVHVGARRSQPPHAECARFRTLRRDKGGTSRDGFGG